MGYTTDFEGRFEFNEPLNEAQIAYINLWASTRRMMRNATCQNMPDPVRIAAGILDVGTEGEFFSGGVGSYGQERDSSVIDANQPPATQPGLWCQWVVTDDGKYLEWDQGEKFYNYVEWLRYMIANFFAPWGKVLNGKVKFQGEDIGDHGAIYVKDNVVTLSKFEEEIPDTVNNYEYGQYSDTEVYIQTTPEQLAANGGKVYLTIRELNALLAQLDD